MNITNHYNNNHLFLSLVSSVSFVLSCFHMYMNVNPSNMTDSKAKATSKDDDVCVTHIIIIIIINSNSNHGGMTNFSVPGILFVNSFFANRTYIKLLLLGKLQLSFFVSFPKVLWEFFVKSRSPAGLLWRLLVFLRREIGFGRSNFNIFTPLVFENSVRESYLLV